MVLKYIFRALQETHDMNLVKYTEIFHQTELSEVTTEKREKTGKNDFWGQARIPMQNYIVQMFFLIHVVFF